MSAVTVLLRLFAAVGVILSLLCCEHHDLSLFHRFKAVAHNALLRLAPSLRVQDIELLLGDVVCLTHNCFQLIDRLDCLLIRNSFRVVLLRVGFVISARRGSLGVSANARGHVAQRAKTASHAAARSIVAGVP